MIEVKRRSELCSESSLSNNKQKAMSLKEHLDAQIKALNESNADKETRIQILNTWINELNTKRSN